MRFGNIFGAVLLLAFGGFWLSLVGMMEGDGVRQLRDQYAAEKYPTAPGVVTKSSVTEYQGSKGPHYKLNLEYRYEVAGHTWVGTRNRYDYIHGGDSVQAVSAAHPVGSAVTVYYNPQQPSDAILSPGVTGGDLMMLIFATPFNMVGLGFLYGAWGCLARAFGSQVAGGVKIIRDGFRLRVRLPVFTPVMMFLVYTGVIGFIATFIVGIGWKFQPPLALALGTLALAYGVGLVAALRQWLIIVKGDDDLVIDSGSASLELPMTYHRKERMTVSFADVAAVDVVVTVTRSNKGNTYSYAPTLRMRNASTGDQKLAGWGDRQKADAFAQWLREEIRVS